MFAVRPNGFAMKRKRLLLAVALLAVSGVAACLTAHSLTASPRIDPDTRDRIRPGMRLDEVTAIIGAPPGDYSSLTLAPWMRAAIRRTSETYDCRVWMDDQYAIVAILDASGVVEYTTLCTFGEPGDTVLDKLRRWR